MPNPTSASKACLFFCSDVSNYVIQSFIIGTKIDGITALPSEVHMITGDRINMRFEISNCQVSLMSCATDYCLFSSSSAGMMLALSVGFWRS